MRIYRSILTAVIVAVLAFACSSDVMAGENDNITYAEFSSMLVKVLLVDMPAGTEGLSDEELYDLQSDLLEERGISIFKSSKPGSVVVYDDLVNVLYDALRNVPLERGDLFGGTPVPDYRPYDYPTSETENLSPTIEEKVGFLVEKGYLPLSEFGTPVTYGQVIAALNIPELSDAVAEAYSAPGEEVTKEQQQAQVPEPEVGRVLPGQAPEPELPVETALLSENDTSSIGRD